MLLYVWMGRTAGWDVYWVVLRVAKQNKHMLPWVYVTVPATQASSAGIWDGPQPRGAYPQHTKIEMVCSRMMMPARADVCHGGQLILEDFLRVETDRLSSLQSPFSKSPLSPVCSLRTDGMWDVGEWRARRSWTGSRRMSGCLDVWR